VPGLRLSKRYGLVASMSSSLISSPSPARFSASPAGANQPT
jgi:hypothetical protein